MNTKFADTVLRMMLIFVFVMGTVWVPTTSAGASPPLAMGDGLYAEYRNLGEAGIVFTVDGEGPINHGWTGACPDTIIYQNQCGLWAGTWNSWSLFEETLTGYIEAPETGTYLFQSWIDDYLEITINGVTDIADDPGGAVYSIEINLVEGQFYPIVMNFKNRWGSNDLSLWWILPGGTNEIVPKQYLYTELPQTPELTLEKTASPTTYNQAGDVIDYSYLLTNTGSGTLSGPFTVTDDKTTVACPSGNLDGTVLFDHFENSHLAQSVFGTPSYVNGLAGFGQAIDFSSGAWLRYNVPGWYQWPSTYDPVGKEGSVDLWVYPKQYGVGFVNFNWSSTDTPPGGGHILHLSLTTEGKLYGGSWSAINGPALIPLPAGNTTIPLNQWSHVAYVWGESGTSLYVNGVQDAYSPDNLYPALNSTFYVYVPYWGYPGIGYIDDLRITSSSQTNFGVSALAEGESIACHGSYVVTQNDVDSGSVTNTAQAHAFFGATPIDSNQDLATAVLVQQYFPTIQVWDSGRVDGIGWPQMNSEMIVTIDDPSTLQVPDFSATGVTFPCAGRPSLNCVNIPTDDFQFAVGQIITLTDVITYTKVFTITSLSMKVTDINPLTDIVSGTADPNSSLTVSIGGIPDNRSRYVTADASGNWVANFAVAGIGESTYDIIPGTNIYTAQCDDDGDCISTGDTVPALLNSFIIVQPNEDRVFGFDWPVGALLELEIDDPVTPQIPDYTASQIFIESDDWGNGFELGGLFDIQPGHLVAVSSGGLTKQLAVAPLTVTAVDIDADTVSGTGDPGFEIHVGTVCDDTGCASRNINVDENGNWLADFSIPVTGDAGIVFDLRPGMGSSAYQIDEDYDSTSVSWQIRNPIFSVHQDEDWLEGYEWTTGVTVNISIDDPSTPQNPDKTGSAVVGASDWNPDDYYFSLDLSNIYDIKAGFQVVVSGGGVTKEHEVTNLVVTNVNAADDTVSGTSDPNAHLRIDIYNTNGVQIEIDSDSNGDWFADFTGLYDLKPGDNGRANEYDDDWDNTSDSWRIPNPSIGARANNDQVEGWEWPLGATVNVIIDDPATPEFPDITRTAEVYEASWNPGEYRFDVNLYGQFDIQPGFVVTASSGTVTKSLLVTSLAFTDIDVDLDFVTGIAAADSRVDVWSCGNNYCVNRHVIADGGGVWSADFAHPGLENDEQDTIDIVLGTWIDSSQREDDGDQTMFGQSVPNPYIEASTNSNWVHARDWPIGTLVTMNISGSSQTYTATMAQASWNPNDPNDIVADFDLQGYDIQSGDVITASADGITKVLTLSQLSVTEFNIAADTITGIATPGVQLQVCANIENRCITRWVTADPYGFWTANYHDPGTGNDDPDTFDVQAGSNGWAAEYEADSDRTWYDWQVPNPNFAVHPDENVIEGNEWPLDSIVTVKIGDPIQPDYTTTTTINPPDLDHNLPWFNLDLSSVYDLLPGELITVSDTVTTKQVIAASRSITLIDPLTDIITGVSDPGVVSVVLWACDENGCAARRKDVNPDGSWSVNFAVPGELNWESLLMDIQPSTNGGVYQSDVDGDGTVYQWILNQPPQADLGPDLVTDEGSTLILDASASSDPESDLMTYAWDLDNDGEYDDAVGVTTGKSFPDNGTYTVGLKVADQYGEFDTDTAQINVVNVAPLVDIQAALANNLGVLSGNGAFTDPGADAWTATVNYGDNTGILNLVLNPDKSFLLNHTYIANGNYTVEVCVSDDDGASGCDQAQVTVTLNRPPVAEAGGPYVGYEGTSITLNASRSTDPDNNIVLYEWDLDNDGLFDDATGVRPKFAAIDNGIFTVRVRVTDVGGLSSEDSSTVTVKNVPPVITSLTINNSVRVGVKLNAYATFKDVGINDTFTATWKWGDGTTSAGTINDKTVNGSHIYAKPGIYLITITIKDKDGGVGQAYKLILVLPKR